jgi:hypothetical protein
MARLVAADKEDHSPERVEHEEQADFGLSVEILLSRLLRD